MPKSTILAYDYDTSIWGGMPGYEPQQHQLDFHHSPQIIRIITGGNSSGKTYSACAEIAYNLQHGHRKGGRLPVHGWVIRPSFTENPHEDPIFVRLWYGSEQGAPFIAPAMQKRIMARNKVMELRNGSTMTFKSYKQDFRTMQGQDPDFIFLDEEPPPEIWAEIKARMLRKPWCFVVMGATLTSSHAYMSDLMAYAESESGKDTVAVFNWSTYSNEYLQSEEQNRIIALFSDAERGYRLEGETKQKYARVYSVWTPMNWRDEEELPPGTDYIFIDPGSGSPCAVLGIRACPTSRVDEHGHVIEQTDIWIHREYYQRGKTNVRELVYEVKEAMFGINPHDWYMDGWGGCQPVDHAGPTMGPLMVSDLWRKCGVPVRLLDKVKKNWRAPRAITARQWMDLNDRSCPNLYATRNLKHFKSELDRYVIEGMIQHHRDLEKKRAEDFTGPNHLLCLMEWACAKELPFVESANSQHNDYTQRQHITQLLWDTAMDQSRDIIGGRHVDFSVRRSS